MICSNIICRDFNEEWCEGMVFDMYQSEARITETLNMADSLDVTIEGRTIIIEDTSKLLHALGVKSEEQFDDLLYALRDADKLSVDYFVWFCEGHALTYRVEGYKLRHAYNLYNKECAEAEQEELKEGRRLYREACGCLGIGFGCSRPDAPVDKPRAYELLRQSANDKHCPRAFGLLARLYCADSKWGKAARTALEGAGKGDAESMAILADLYEKGADFEQFTDNLGPSDMPKSVEWCLAAAKKGSGAAARRLSRYIAEGWVALDTAEIMSILTRNAKRLTLPRTSKSKK